MVSASGANIVAFPGRQPDQVGFTREELTKILDVYGRMVAAGNWRDYAMEFTKQAATFDLPITLGILAVQLSKQAQRA